MFAYRAIGEPKSKNFRDTFVAYSLVIVNWPRRRTVS
jgi:hypothetical protein